MVILEELEPGMKVKIVDEWNRFEVGANSAGEMDKWLGKTMTVREVFDDVVKMEEDKEEFADDGWYWNSRMFDRVVADGPVNDIEFEESDFLSMLGV